MITDTEVHVLRFLLLTSVYIPLAKIDTIGVNDKSISARKISFY